MICPPAVCQFVQHHSQHQAPTAALGCVSDLADKKLTVAVIGGSIAAGTGAEDAPSWVDRLETYLKESYGRVAAVNVTVNNGAVPGTTSSYMSGCVNLHVPSDADVVVVEYTVNDEYEAVPTMNNPMR